MGISNIKQLYSEWKSLQPLKPEDLKRWNDKFKLEFNYNSNHLEGNTLTYGQTKLLLMFGETSGNASLKDYEEMKAHNVGLEMIKQEAQDKERPLTESFIRELNRTILVQDYWKNAKTPDGQDIRMQIKVGEMCIRDRLMYDQRPSYSLMKSFILVLLLENVRVPITVKKASLSTILGYIIFIIFSRSLSKV